MFDTLFVSHFRRSREVRKEFSLRFRKAEEVKFVKIRILPVSVIIMTNFFDCPRDVHCNAL